MDIQRQAASARHLGGLLHHMSAPSGPKTAQFGMALCALGQSLFGQGRFHRGVHVRAFRAVGSG